MLEQTSQCHHLLRSEWKNDGVGLRRAAAADEEAGEEAEAEREHEDEHDARHEPRALVARHRTHALSATAIPAAVSAA